MKFFIQIFVVICILLSAFACAQSPTQITARCPNSSIFSLVGLAAIGDIHVDPCPARTTFFTGNVDFSGAVVTGTVTGSGTANFIPRFTASTVLGNTPFSWDGTKYLFNNTALNSESTLEFTPSITLGSRFRVGDCAITPTVCLEVVQGASGFVQLQANNNAYLALSPTLLQVNSSVTTFNGTGTAGTFTVNTVNGQFGDVNSATNGTVFTIDDNFPKFEFTTGALDGTLVLQGIQKYQVQRTITSAGTTGNRTINTPYGTVNFAAGASDIVVTSSIVLSTSLIFCTVQSNDTTATSCRVTDKTGGSFHIRVPAATGETSVAFQVTN